MNEDEFGYDDGNSHSSVALGIVLYGMACFVAGVAVASAIAWIWP